MSEVIVATWSISLDVKCPHCDKDFDVLSDENGPRTWVKPLEERHKVELECPHCGHEFQADFQY